jgi:hypothetical protein
MNVSCGILSFELAAAKYLSDKRGGPHILDTLAAVLRWIRGC